MLSLYMSPAKPLLQKQITYLINKVINSKRFEFETGSYGFVFDDLLKNGTVKLLDEKVIVKAFDAISELSLPKFEKLYGFKWTKNADILKFYSQIHDHFDDKGYISGRHEFSQQIFKHILLKFKVKFRGDIFNLVKGLSKKDHEIYDLTQILGEVLPNLNLTADEVISLITWLSEEIKVEEPGVIDLNLPAVGQGIRALCCQNPTLGKELYQKCLLSQPHQLDRFHPSIISGLLDNDLKFLANIENIVEQDNLQSAVTCALGSAKYDAYTPFAEFVRIVESVKHPTKNYELELPRFYTSIIKSEFVKDKVLIDYCFGQISKMINNDDKLLHKQILSEFRYLKVYSDNVTAILSSMIEEPYFDENYIPGITNMFYNHENCIHFFKIFRQLAMKFKPKLPIEKTVNDCMVLRNKNKASFDEELIKLLIDDEGYLRMLGTRILSRMGLCNYVSGFGYDPLDLSAVSQYKLAITLAEDHHEPKEVLPYFIPLLLSNFDLVRELTIHKIEILCENFGQEVIEVLKERLDQANTVHNECFVRVAAYLENFEAMLDKKKDIKELDPYYTMSKHWRQYYMSKEKDMRERINKEPDPGSFLSMIPTVKLMKGGGWKAAPTKKVSQLSTIQTRMRLPRAYVLSPQLFDWKRQLAFVENWENKFDEWEAIISL